MRREIADTIYKRFEALRLDEVSSKDAFKTIQSDIKVKFGEEYASRTIEKFAYRTFDEIKEYQDRCTHSKKCKDAVKTYHRALIKPRSKEFELSIDVFTGPDVELSLRQVWEKVGGSYSGIGNNLKEYCNSGVLIREKRKDKFFYRLNPKSPFVSIADGLFKKKEEEMDNNFVKS